MIVGQGLAGSTLAWRLLERGWSVLVVDRDESETSSRVAAGLLTPITGRNLAPSWRVDETLPEARSFYREVERRCCRRILFDRETVRIFRSAAESARWRSRWEDDRAMLEPWVVEPWVTPGHASPRSRSPWGAFIMGGGWLDVPGFLDATRTMLAERGAFLAAEFDERDIRISDDQVEWRGVGARRLVFCQGHEGGDSRFFDWVRFRSAKGEILDLEIDEDAPGAARILNGSVWLVPLENGSFRAGSTYSWHELDTRPTVAARADIEARLHRLLPGGFRVRGQRAAVRPIIDASRVLMGIHPAHPCIGFFNGLGSKGSMNAPFFAAQLADHLVHDHALDEEVDLRRNLF